MNYFITIILVTIISIVLTSFVQVLIRYVICRKPIRNKWFAGMITIPSLLIGGLLGEVLSKGVHGIFWPAFGSAIISYEILRAGINKHTTEPSGGNVSEEYFIEILKSAIKENRLDIIPNEDLLKICERASSINKSGNIKDMELAEVINILLEEIKQRGLSLTKTLE